MRIWRVWRNMEKTLNCTVGLRKACRRGFKHKVNPALRGGRTTTTTTTTITRRALMRIGKHTREWRANDVIRWISHMNLMTGMTTMGRWMLTRSGRQRPWRHLSRLGLRLVLQRRLQVDFWQARRVGILHRSRGGRRRKRRKSRRRVPAALVGCKTSWCVE